MPSVPAAPDSLDRPKAILTSASQLFADDERDSALILLYALLDILGSLTRPENQQSSTPDDFRNFVDKYVLPRSPLGCTANDLWAARCGILHDLSPESDHSRSGRARRIIHMGGLEETDSGLRWEEAIERSLQAVPGVLKVPVDSIRVVHVKTLLSTIEVAIGRLSFDLASNAALRERLGRRVQEELVGLWVREQ
jgi:hypothetical protein